MALKICTPEDVREHLEKLELWQLKRLSRLSKVPYTTLYGLRQGVTRDPRLSTINAIAPHYRACQRPH